MIQKNHFVIIKIETHPIGSKLKYQSIYMNKCTYEKIYKRKTIISY